jgi:hypothetical protein
MLFAVVHNTTAAVWLTIQAVAVTMSLCTAQRSFGTAHCIVVSPFITCQGLTCDLLPVLPWCPGALVPPLSPLHPITDRPGCGPKAKRVKPSKQEALKAAQDKQARLADAAARQDKVRVGRQGWHCGSG